MLERTKKQLSSLSALNSLHHGEDRKGTEIEKAQKIDTGGAHKSAHRNLPPGKGTGAAQRSYQRSLKDRGKRKHQYLQFLLSYSYLSVNIITPVYKRTCLFRFLLLCPVACAAGDTNMSAQ